MSEPFFDYIARHRLTVSNYLYGKEVEEKKYSRLKYIELPHSEEPTVTLSEAMRLRQSTRKYKDGALTKAELSGLLEWSIAKRKNSKGFKHYPFPSGGAFYPMETYILVNKMHDMESGVYHYSADTHRIAKIKNSPDYSLIEINSIYGCFFESLPDAIIHMTMVKSRAIHKYGSLCYSLAFMEAGHRGQNICLNATTLDIGVCPMGGGEYSAINEMLGIDGVNEHHVYGLALGKKI